MSNITTITFTQMMKQYHLSSSTIYRHIRIGQLNPIPHPFGKDTKKFVFDLEEVRASFGEPSSQKA